MDPHFAAQLVERRFYVRGENNAPEVCVYYTFIEDKDGGFAWRAGWSFRHSKDNPNKRTARMVAESRWFHAPLRGKTTATGLHAVRADILKQILDNRLCPRRLEGAINDRIYFDTIDRDMGGEV